MRELWWQKCRCQIVDENNGNYVYNSPAYTDSRVDVAHRVYHPDTHTHTLSAAAAKCMQICPPCYFIKQKKIQFFVVVVVVVVVAERMPSSVFGRLLWTCTFSTAAQSLWPRQKAQKIIWNYIEQNVGRKGTQLELHGNFTEWRKSAPQFPWKNVYGLFWSERGRRGRQRQRQRQWVWPHGLV